jgi:hypothetical protein
MLGFGAFDGGMAGLKQRLTDQQPDNRQDQDRNDRFNGGKPGVAFSSHVIDFTLTMY